MGQLLPLAQNKWKTQVRYNFYVGNNYKKVKTI